LAWKAAQPIDQGSSATLNNRGVVLSAQNNLVEALESFLRAAKLRRRALQSCLALKELKTSRGSCRSPAQDNIARPQLVRQETDRDHRDHDRQVPPATACRDATAAPSAAAAAPRFSIRHGAAQLRLPAAYDY
jgi:hypothetical protein